MLEILLETLGYLFETLEVIVNYYRINYINHQKMLGNNIMMFMKGSDIYL